MYALLCSIMLYYALLCSIKLYYPLLSHIMLYHALLCSRKPLQLFAFHGCLLSMPVFSSSIVACSYFSSLSHSNPHPNHTHHVSCFSHHAKVVLDPAAVLKSFIDTFQQVSQFLGYRDCLGARFCASYTVWFCYCALLRLLVSTLIYVGNFVLNRLSRR